MWKQQVLNTEEKYHHGLRKNESLIDELYLKTFSSYFLQGSNL